MRKILVLCLSFLFSAGALIVPASFAAEKSEFTAMEIFYPAEAEVFLPDFLALVPFFVPSDFLDLVPDFPALLYGEASDLPMITCPGDELTGNPVQPCPIGSRTHMRNGVVRSEVFSDDPRMTGEMMVVFNANVDANFEGPAWGTFIFFVKDSDGIWEGTWQGLRVAEDGHWTAELNVRGKGIGGDIDGMKLMAVDKLFLVTPLPFAYIGTIEGRIIDPN